MRKGPWIGKYPALNQRLRLIYQDEEPDETFNSLTLPWSVTNAFFSDWPEDRESVGDFLPRMMTIQMTNDLEDLIVNGDASGTDALLKAMDGYLKLGGKCGSRPNLYLRGLTSSFVKDKEGVRYVVKLWVKLDLDLDDESLAA
jgi:hypothetical protein